jgi:hypothetical protein
MTKPIDDAALFAEIGKDLRRRMPGIWLVVVLALLLLVGVAYSAPMMHSGNPKAADGTIVAVERDPQTGELWMTSEFTDDTGTVHRDRETDGYHYAPGDPVVGQSIRYFYERGQATGDLQAYPRADYLLKWVFGAPAALLVLFAAITLWFLLRRRALRRRLVRVGRREPGQMPRIRQRTLVLPAGRNVQAIEQWRLEARYFEPTRTEFVDCHSEWQPAPAPELAKDAPPPTILVDPERPARYWLPVATATFAT